jgi:hypothetical protein
MSMLTKWKHLMAGGFGAGFCVGCVPNDVNLYVNGQLAAIPIPLITGLISSAGMVMSPLLLANYFCNGTYIDRWVDRVSIHVKRYHQYDGNGNKYAYPSIVDIYIKTKVKAAKDTNDTDVISINTNTDPNTKS